MIFATVGTTHFDALTRCLDEAVGFGTISEEVVIQIGYGGQYTPRHCRYFRLAPTLEPFERSAALTISHGGATTLEILIMGKPLISVANPALQDNHQHYFLEALEGLGIVTYCRHLDDLPAMIVNHSRVGQRVEGAAQLATQLTAVVLALGRRRRSDVSWMSRVGQCLASAWEIDVAGTLRVPRETSQGLCP